MATKLKKAPPNAVMPQVTQISVEGIHSTFKMLGGFISNNAEKYRKNDNYTLPGTTQKVPLPRLGKRSRKTLITPKQLQAAIRVMLKAGHPQDKITQALMLNGAIWTTKPTPNPTVIAELTKKQHRQPKRPQPSLTTGDEPQEPTATQPPKGHTWSDFTLEDLARHVLTGTQGQAAADADEIKYMRRRIAQNVAAKRDPYVTLLQEKHILRDRPGSSIQYTYKFTEHAVTTIKNDINNSKTQVLQPTGTLSVESNLKEFQQQPPPEGHQWSTHDLQGVARHILTNRKTTINDADIRFTTVRIGTNFSRMPHYQDLLADGHVLRYRPTPKSPYKYKFTHHAIAVITDSINSNSTHTRPPAPTPAPHTEKEVTVTHPTASPRTSLDTLSLPGAAKALLARFQLDATYQDLGEHLVVLDLSALTIDIHNATQTTNTSSFGEAVSTLIRQHSITPQINDDLTVNISEFLIDLEHATRT